MRSPNPAYASLDPRTLAQLKGLAVRARRVVDGVLQGTHRSPHHGSSVEFAEHKEYSPGDEIRHLDWRAYGRLDRYYIKKFEHESNLRAWFALDTSGSMAYGAEGGMSKMEYASLVAASLALLLLRQQDAVGMLTFADEVHTLIPARGRLGQLRRVCEALEAVRPARGTRLDVGLARIGEQAKKRGLIYVLSDFFGPHDDAFRILRQLVSRGHQVTVFHVLDGDELTFPFEALTLFEGMETDMRLLAEPGLVRQAYLGRMGEHLDTVRRRCLEGRITYVLADTRHRLDRLLIGALTAPG